MTTQTSRPPSTGPRPGGPPGSRPSGPPGSRPGGFSGPRPGGAPGGSRPGGSGGRPGGGRPGGRPGGRFGGRRGRPRYYSRRKICGFCVDHIEFIDYKDTDRFRRYMTDRWKIESRRKTGVCSKHQRALATAIKRARHLALIPFSPDHDGPSMRWSR
jgi:small subunit ribosomal protein S18